MSNVATRLLSIILLLQSKPSWKAGELAHELHVSERTIHRYMSMLDEMGIPIYSERGPYGGFSLVRGYKLPPLIFSAEEATVLYMGANLVREVWGQTYEDAVTAVTAKLDNVLPDDLRQQVAMAQEYLVVEGLTARNYRQWDAVLHTLRQCIEERRCVRLRYRGAAGQESERTLHPYGLAFQWGLWYVAGLCCLREEIRTFRVDRIQELEPLKETFTIPDGATVRTYMAQALRFDPSYMVTVHLQPHVAPLVKDRHGHWMEIDEHADGSITAHFGVTNLEWATGWVLGYGAAAKVLEPDELIARVCQAAQGALRRYAE